MGRAPCCDKVGLNRGAWTREEDAKLVQYIKVNGEGNWRALPKAAGLLRCGKSCRLRWINYLRPDLKRGNITEDEDTLIIKLHSMLGNRWSMIARRLPGRTDNEIKNYWNTHLKKKLKAMGIDPHTHQPLIAAEPSKPDSSSFSTAMLSSQKLLDYPDRSPRGSLNRNPNLGRAENVLSPFPLSYQYPYSQQQHYADCDGRPLKHQASMQAHIDDFKRRNMDKYQINEFLSCRSISSATSIVADSSATNSCNAATQCRLDYKARPMFNLECNNHGKPYAMMSHAQETTASSAVPGFMNMLSQYFVAAPSLPPATCSTGVSGSTTVTRCSTPSPLSSKSFSPVGSCNHPPASVISGNLGFSAPSKDHVSKFSASARHAKRTDTQPSEGSCSIQSQPLSTTQVTEEDHSFPVVAKVEIPSPLESRPTLRDPPIQALQPLVNGFYPNQAFTMHKGLSMPEAIASGNWGSCTARTGDTGKSELTSESDVTIHKSSTSQVPSLFSRNTAAVKGERNGGKARNAHSSKPILRLEVGNTDNDNSFLPMEMDGNDVHTAVMTPDAHETSLPASASMPSEVGILDLWDLDLTLSRPLEDDLPEMHDHMQLLPTPTHLEPFLNLWTSSSANPWLSVHNPTEIQAHTPRQQDQRV
ncbi:hypothetical protein KP509_17G037700 [Ceratopteris richardii]|uniref:Uncharacterized protein n=1 Tax=Ceratopteris richardii TaxID=49495 RepID=A0A8T2SYL1_CERRI|nr:hypothetical protein KP509_17G037700 [Ceratopteris richardii]